MASSAFIELGLACDLFEKGAVHSRRARSGLVRLRLLSSLSKAKSQLFVGYFVQDARKGIPGVLPIPHWQWKPQPRSFGR